LARPLAGPRFPWLAERASMTPSGRTCSLPGRGPRGSRSGASLTTRVRLSKPPDARRGDRRAARFPRVFHALDTFGAERVYLRSERGQAAQSGGCPVRETIGSQIVEDS